MDGVEEDQLALVALEMGDRSEVNQLADELGVGNQGQQLLVHLTLCVIRRDYDDASALAGGGLGGMDCAKLLFERVNHSTHNEAGIGVVEVARAVIPLVAWHVQHDHRSSGTWFVETQELMNAFDLVCDAIMGRNHLAVVELLRREGCQVVMHAMGDTQMRGRTTTIVHSLEYGSLTCRTNWLKL